MKTKSYFIARDKNHSLWMYNSKPKRRENEWAFPDGDDDYDNVVDDDDYDNVVDDDYDDYHDDCYCATVELDTSYDDCLNTDLFKNLSFEDGLLELVPKKNNKYVKGKSYFVATDSNGDVYIYNSKPYKDDYVWRVNSGGYCQGFTSNDLFEKQTFDDDPIELVLIDKAKSSIKESSKDCFDNIFDVKL